ncbi:MAG TPA: oligopeptide/dipeptide ABC transporter ATP-binding protein [Thermoplasmata archaeon]|jgi:oligopeptide/dipeptide ABC transporter ATP-binding protein
MSRKVVATRRLVKHFMRRRGFGKRATRSIHAVDDVSLEIESGSTLGLVGESGSGKTTVGRLLLHLVEPTSGDIYFDIGTDELAELDRSSATQESRTRLAELQTKYGVGKSSEALKRLRRRAQMVFQDPFSSLDPRMLVRDIVAEPLVVLNLARGSELEDRVVEVLDKVGLTQDDLFRFPHEFSGGQRQRIGLARALVPNPTFVVLDEPTSALDVSVQAQMLNLLRRLQRSSGLSYLFISHDLSVVDHMADRVAVMYAGEIVEIADKEPFFAKPLHPYSELLLAAVPRPDPQRRAPRVVAAGDVPSPENPPAGCRFHPRCPYAVEVCRRIKPPLEDKGNQHRVACHLR